jgi:phosphoribosylglycinamide formyltransferase-1
MPVQVIDRKDQFFRKRLEDELLKINPDFIVLAGFLSILPDSILDNFRHRIINTHPALLPCFGGMGMYGLRVHRAVIESGARYSGCTIHLVTGEVDGGPIIAQSIVEVKDNDTAESLSDRVKEAEHLLMTETLRKLLTSDYAVSGKRVVFS